MAPSGIFRVLPYADLDAWAFAAIPFTEHLPRGYSVGIGRTCRRQLYDLLRGLIAFMAKRPIRLFGKHVKIIRRERVWKPPKCS